MSDVITLKTNLTNWMEEVEEVTFVSTVVHACGSEQVALVSALSGITLKPFHQSIQVNFLAMLHFRFVAVNYSLFNYGSSNT